MQKSLLLTMVNKITKMLCNEFHETWLREHIGNILHRSITTYYLQPTHIYHGNWKEMSRVSNPLILGIIIYLLRTGNPHQFRSYH